MEAAGVLPPTDKFGRGAKSNRPSAAAAATVEEDAGDDRDSEDVESLPVLLEDDDDLDAEHGEDSDGKNPPEIDPAA